MGSCRRRPCRQRRARCRRRRPDRGAFDGTWNVTFTPQAGNCHASNTVPFNVSGTRVSSAGGGKVTGGVTRNGNVTVRITVGASWADGSGRLAGNSGVGRWSGLITGDRCSGVWQATPELVLPIGARRAGQTLGDRIVRFAPPAGKERVNQGHRGGRHSREAF